jgi:pyruvate/2-oxoglutarate dehydrogenase complex dihydrolipoamide acyltransferase (E2) component
VHDVILPKTGIYEDDVVLIEWIVAEGSWVAVGDPIFVIESEKVEMEIESNDEGWIHLEVEPGFQASIGTRVAVVADTELAYRGLVGET